MKRSISIFAIAALVVAGISSCNTTEENEAPVVTIISPTSADNPYTSGMPISINIEATDDLELHEIAISVVRAHDSEEVFVEYDHSHGTSYAYQVDTMFTTTVHSDFTITATVSDHEGEETVATEVFHMHPM